MILELKRNKEHKGTTRKSLAEEVRTLAAEATLKVKNLDEGTEAEELDTALRQQCDCSCSATEGPGRDTGSLGAATCGGRKHAR